MTPARLAAADLRALPAQGPTDCKCASLRCPGWESLAQPIQEPHLRLLGTLRSDSDGEPSFETLPGSGDYWSAAAPISISHFPANRCEVWTCVTCGRGFLQYTEYGGYYVDHRIRQLDPSRVV